MDGISRSRGWDKEIPHGVLPMEQLVLSDKWARKKYRLGHRFICPMYRTKSENFLHLQSLMKLEFCLKHVLRHFKDINTS